MALVPNQSYANENTPLFVDLVTLRVALAPTELQTAPILVNVPNSPTPPIAIPNIASYPTEPNTWYDVSINGTVELLSGTPTIGDIFQLTLQLGSDPGDQFKLEQMVSILNVGTPFYFRVRNKNVSFGTIFLSAAMIEAGTGNFQLSIDSVSVTSVPA